LIRENTYKELYRESLPEYAEVVNKGEDDEAIIYVSYIIQRVIAKYNVKPLWFIQNPGETVFIPGGWWHVVVNLDDTVAITQNYCNSVNFNTVWVRVRHERKKMAVQFLQRLQKYRPDLYERAVELNKMDNFTMYDKKFLGKKRGNERHSTSSASSSSFIADYFYQRYFVIVSVVVPRMDFFPILSSAYN
jgi:histone arginine demethylase JMJD6